MQDLISGVDSDVPVVGFAGDVPDCFYRLALPEWLHEHLWLADVDMDVLREVFLEAGECFASFEGCAGVGFVCPPMGWSWSPWIAQETLEHIVARVTSPTPMSDTSRVVHHRPPPIVEASDITEPPHWQCIDDYGGVVVGPRAAARAKEYRASVRQQLGCRAQCT